MMPFFDISGYSTKVQDKAAFNLILSKITFGTRLLEDADNEFLATAYEIETCGDVVKQQQLAYDFINEHPTYTKKLNLDKLRLSLANIKSWAPEYCRQAYMLQYSIPLTSQHRSNNYRPFNWIQRLMVFTNTFIVESSVVLKSWNGYVFRFKTHGKNKVVDHKFLDYGPGEELADYYFWDETVQKLFASVDLKCNYTDRSIEDIAESYLDKKPRHYARFILVYQHNENTYYMVDYDKVDRACGELSYEKVADLPLPVGLYDINNF